MCTLIDDERQSGFRKCYCYAFYLKEYELSLSFNLSLNRKFICRQLSGLIRSESSAVLDSLFEDLLANHDPSRRKSRLSSYLNQGQRYIYCLRGLSETERRAKRAKFYQRVRGVTTPNIRLA